MNLETHLLSATDPPGLDRFRLAGRASNEGTQNPTADVKEKAHATHDENQSNDTSTTVTNDGLVTGLCLSEPYRTSCAFSARIALLLSANRRCCFAISFSACSNRARRFCDNGAGGNKLGGGRDEKGSKEPREGGDEM